MPRHASSTATAMPAAPEYHSAVAWTTAGSVIAVSTAYGVNSRNVRNRRLCNSPRTSNSGSARNA